MRAAIVGGGVIGLSVAWRLADDGHAVEVFDDAPGTGASYAAAGMLAPAGEAWFNEDALVRIGAQSLQMWPEFAAELSRVADHDVWLRREGSLLVGTDEADAADLDRVHGLLEQHGLTAERLTRREARRLEPALTTSLRRTVLVPGDRSVHNRRVIEALLRACERAGVGVRPERADVVVDEQGAATGVRGRQSGAVHEADVTVVAAGSALSGVEGVPALLRSAVRPVKGEILRLHSSQTLLQHTVRARVRGDTVYAVPRPDGGIVLGATSDERDDLRVTADGVYEVLRRGIAVVPGLRECELVEATARARPGTADNGPLVGETGVPNLLLAAGHYRGGVLMAPVTALAVTSLLRGDAVPDTVAPFTPLRLTDPQRASEPDRLTGAPR
ncbi:MAG TPA: glycine oxidase ThiO [Nocardioidaceae bacterium]|nr:glycine oxidase ThiO [Nocardioidaceae bacterium]